MELLFVLRELLNDLDDMVLDSAIVDLDRSGAITIEREFLLSERTGESPLERLRQRAEETSACV